MAPFHVPGWSMDTAPTEQLSHSSKKRKRPSSRSIIHSAEINFEKLVATLKDVESDGNIAFKSTDKSKKKKRKRRRISEDVKHNSMPSTSRKPVSSPPVVKNSSGTSLQHSKRGKNDAGAASASLKPQNISDSRLTALQKNMKQNLGGARFR